MCEIELRLSEATSTRAEWYLLVIQRDRPASEGNSQMRTHLTRANWGRILPVAVRVGVQCWSLLSWFQRPRRSLPNTQWLDGKIRRECESHRRKGFVISCWLIWPLNRRTTQETRLFRETTNNMSEVEIHGNVPRISENNALKMTELGIKRMVPNCSRFSRWEYLPAAPGNIASRTVLLSITKQACE